MARQIRLEFAGAMYHILARGDRREPIVRDDRDREMFVRTLGEVCERGGWVIHAWVLMGNHFHWVLETPEPNLVRGMAWFMNAFTRRMNIRHRLWGHLFGGRYKSIVVQSDNEQGSDYLAALVNYVHLNPVRSGLVSPEKGRGLLDYRWSSLSQAYAIVPAKRPRWMNAARGLSSNGQPDTVAGRRGYLRRLEGIARRESQAGMEARETQGLQSTLRRGWYWGGEAFRESLLKLVEQRRNPRSRHHRSAPERMETEKQRAERLVVAGLEALAMSEEDLDRRPGSQREKVLVAAAVFSRTTLSQQWLADRLRMKSAVNVSQQIRRLRDDPQFKRELEALLSRIDG